MLQDSSRYNSIVFLLENAATFLKIIKQWKDNKANFKNSKNGVKFKLKMYKTGCFSRRQVPIKGVSSEESGNLKRKKKRKAPTLFPFSLQFSREFSSNVYYPF